MQRSAGPAASAFVGGVATIKKTKEAVVSEAALKSTAFASLLRSETDPAWPSCEIQQHLYDIVIIKESKVNTVIKQQ